MNCRRCGMTWQVGVTCPLCDREAKIERLQTALERETEAHKMTAGVAEALAKDKERLQAIVAKLPKTVDEVPITDGMPLFTTEAVWFDNGASLQPPLGGPIKLKMELVPMYSGTPVCGVDLSLCGSTREAARKASDE